MTNALKSIVREIYGLFVDDGSFAVSVIAWLGLAWLVIPHLDVSPAARGPILFAGLVLILIESTVRRARK